MAYLWGPIHSGRFQRLRKRTAKLNVVADRAMLKEPELKAIRLGVMAISKLTTIVY